MAVASPLMISEPVPGGTLLIRYAMQKPVRRDMRSPFPPAWPWQTDPETALLLAFVDIVAAHPGDVPAMIALFASALRRLEDREQGKLSAADRKRDGRPIFPMTGEIRALFGQPDPVRALIGHRDRAGDVWVGGLAGLTESERDAYWLHLHGLSRAAIALALVPNRAARFGRAGAIPLATVSKYLWRARSKLRSCFGRRLEGEAEYLAALDAEEERAARELRDVDPAMAAAAQAERDRRMLAWPARWEERGDLAEPRAADEENPEGEPWLR